MARKRKKHVAPEGLLPTPIAARFSRLRHAGIVDNPKFKRRFMQLVQQYLPPENRESN